MNHPLSGYVSQTESSSVAPYGDRMWGVQHRLVRGIRWVLSSVCKPCATADREGSHLRFSAPSVSERIQWLPWKPVSKVYFGLLFFLKNFLACETCGCVPGDLLARGMCGISCGPYDAVYWALKFIIRIARAYKSSLDLRRLRGR